jgi:hypothetical protein
VPALRQLESAMTTDTEHSKISNRPPSLQSGDGAVDDGVSSVTSAPHGSDALPSKSQELSGQRKVPTPPRPGVGGLVRPGSSPNLGSSVASKGAPASLGAPRGPVQSPLTKTLPLGSLGVSTVPASVAHVPASKRQGGVVSPPISSQRVPQERVPQGGVGSPPISSQRSPLSDVVSRKIPATESRNAVVAETKSTSDLSDNAGANSSHRPISEVPTENNAPTQPPKPAPKLVISDRPSEQTRIFSVNLQDPQLKRSEAPGAPDTAHDAAQLSIPQGPKVPTGISHEHQSREHDFVGSYVDEQTRTYSTETINKLLGDGDTELSKTPNTNEAASNDEVTRIYSNPPAALLATEGGSAKSSPVSSDDITRTYDSPLEKLKLERDVVGTTREFTSPGRRSIANAEPLVIIKTETQSRSKAPYIVLGICGVVAALLVGFRAPLANQTQRLFSSVTRGMNPAHTVATKAPPPIVDVSISISVSPADARLTLDGVTVSNPLVMKRRPDNRPHELVAEAAGHQSLKRSLSFERDLTVMMGLAPQPQAATSPAVPQADVSAVSPVHHAAAQVAVPQARPKKAAPVADASDTPDPQEAKTAPEKASCAVPYSVDSNGIKTFKPECL